MDDDSIVEDIVCENALRIYADLLKETPSTSAEGEIGFIFKASRGWFKKFKHRSEIHSVVAHTHDLVDDMPDGFYFIYVKFLQPNATHLLQPMDQQVIFWFENLCRENSSESVLK